MMDFYEIRKMPINQIKPDGLIVDECDIISIIRMTKTRNKSLHKKLLKWFKESNKDQLKSKKKGGYGLENILDGIEDIF